jgi:hypothetical protein
MEGLLRGNRRYVENVMLVSSSCILTLSYFLTKETGPKVMKRQAYVTSPRDSRKKNKGQRWAWVDNFGKYDVAEFDNGLEIIHFTSILRDHLYRGYSIWWSDAMFAFCRNTGVDENTIVHFQNTGVTRMYCVSKTLKTLSNIVCRCKNNLDVWAKILTRCSTTDPLQLKQSVSVANISAFFMSLSPVLVVTAASAKPPSFSLKFLLIRCPQLLPL